MTINVQTTELEKIFPAELNDYDKFYSFLIHETAVQQTSFSWNVLEGIHNTKFCTVIRDSG
jgi:hypothetical protein